MGSYSWRVPLSVNGELQLVAIQDLGELGPREGKPVVISVSPVRHVWALLPWLVILLLLLAPANRARGAWLVLIPILLFAVPCGMIAGMGTSITSLRLLFGGAQVIGDLALCFGAIWLVMNGQRGETLGRAVLITLVMIAMLSLQNLISSAPGALLNAAIKAGLLGVTIISAALAGRICRRAFNGLSFTLVLLPSLALFVFLPLFVVAFAVLGRFLGSGISWPILLGVAVWGVAITVSLYTAALPFLVLAFTSRFYRARFVPLFVAQASSLQCEGSQEACATPEEAPAEVGANLHLADEDDNDFKLRKGDGGDE